MLYGFPSITITRRGREFVWALGHARGFLLSGTSCLLRVDIPLVGWPHLESEPCLGKQEDRCDRISQDRQEREAIRG